MRKWFRNYIHVKQLTNPQYGAYMKNRLVLIYTFAAWNLFGIVLTMCYKQNLPTPHDSTDYAKVLGIKDATVIQLSNFSKVNQYEIKLTDKELNDFSSVIGTEEELKKYEQQNEERIKAAKEKKTM
ncbi:uncharacterized protein LOC131663510 [Phymastichus coffea]|uniref:uncharacterized protein LOC131663510 n=1 Tax=Phymastichus coffea TaxID=108790 RepID=UPI00273C1D29|nr:uncharacterized protein LOC131663510 [Phymastichus coffea]